MCYMSLICRCIFIIACSYEVTGVTTPNGHMKGQMRIHWALFYSKDHFSVAGGSVEGEKGGREKGRKEKPVKTVVVVSELRLRSAITCRTARAHLTASLPHLHTAMHQDKC